MNVRLTSIANAVTSKAGRQILAVRRHSPAILFGVGIVGVVATVVLACKATLEVDEILEEHATDLEKMKTVREERGEYTEEKFNRDKLVLMVRTAGKLTRLYAIPAAVGVVAVTALTGSQIVLTRRNLAVTAAYAALDKGFKEYRERVVKELGQDRDDEFRYGFEDREIVEETDTGPVVKTVRTVGPNGASIYARFFDEASEAWEPNSMTNRMFLNCQNTYLNDLLNARGYVFLNEVYKALGLEQNRLGQTIGWVKGKGKQNHISFGIYDRTDERARAFVNGRERSILLDFNVDGDILTHLPE